MKYFVITDSTDTQVGLRLAGIEGVVVREEPLVRAVIQTGTAPAAPPTPSPATSGRPLESSSDQLREEVNYA